MIAEQLQSLLLENEGCLITTNEVQFIQFDERGPLKVSMSLPVDSLDMLLDIITTFEGIEIFLKSTNCRTMAQIQTIGEKQLWKQYLKGQGFVNATLLYSKGEDIGFRIMGRSTEIFSRDLHYYDEVWRKISSTEAILKAIYKRWPKKELTKSNIVKMKTTKI